MKSPFSCDVDHNLYGHFMARRRRKKEGDPDPMQSATVDAWVSGPIVEIKSLFPTHSAINEPQKLNSNLKILSYTDLN